MRDLAAGVRYLGRGQSWVLGHGRWFLFGLLPALVTLVLYAAALGTLGFFTPDLVGWGGSLAESWGWSPGWETTFGVAFVALLWAGVLTLAVISFAAVTLLVGDPFYEKLSEEVEKSEGGCPDGPDLPLWRELWNSVRDSLFVLWRAMLFAVPLFVLGFLPVVGQTVIPVLSLCVSGFFLALELTSVALQRRGIPVRDRLRMLRRRKALALGFGAPLALLFLVPPVAVLLMPGAVAGAALLVRDLTGDDEAAPSGPGRIGPERGTYAQEFSPPPAPGASR